MSDSATILSSTSTALVAEATKPGGLALAFTGIALSLVSYAVLPGTCIPGQLGTAIAIVCAGIIWILLSALRNSISKTIQLGEDNIQYRRDNEALKKIQNVGTPRVIEAKVNPVEPDKIIILLEKNALFGQSMLVSLYYMDGKHFELEVASGRVASIQINGMIQVHVESWMGAHLHIKSEVQSSNAEILGRLIVRPAPTTTFKNDAIPREDSIKILTDSYDQSIEEDDDN